MVKKRKEKVKEPEKKIGYPEQANKMFLAKEWGKMKQVTIYDIAAIETFNNKKMTEKEFEELLKKVQNIQSSY